MRRKTRHNKPITFYKSYVVIKIRLGMSIEIILMIVMYSIMEGVNHAVQQLMGACNYIVM